MSKNKKNLIVNLFSSVVLLLIGIIYLLIPGYLNLFGNIDLSVNNLFVSVLLLFSITNLAEYIIVGKNPTQEPIFLTIASALTGIVNVIMIGFNVNSSLTLAMTLMIWIVLIGIIKLFTMDYYHDRHDGYFYIELVSFVVFILVGTITCLNLFNDAVLQTIMLGFFLILYGVLDFIVVTFKGLLKSKKFVKSISLK